MSMHWRQYYSWSKSNFFFCFLFAREFCIEQMLQEQCCEHKAFIVSQFGQMLDCLKEAICEDLKPCRMLCSYSPQRNVYTAVSVFSNTLLPADAFPQEGKKKSWTHKPICLPATGPCELFSGKRIAAVVDRTCPGLVFFCRLRTSLTQCLNIWGMMWNVTRTYQIDGEVWGIWKGIWTFLEQITRSQFKGSCAQLRLNMHTVGVLLERGPCAGFPCQQLGSWKSS